MIDQIISDGPGILLSFAYVFAFIGIAEYLRRRGVLDPSSTRKVVHIGVAHWWLIAMAFMHSVASASLGPVAFILINALSFKFHLFKGMEDPEPSKNFGTIYFPISLLILVQLAWGGWIPIWAAGVGILVMGWGDGLAALVGERVASPWGRVFGARKSLAGTLAMIAASFGVVFTMTLAFSGTVDDKLIWVALYRAAGTALVAAFLEAATPLGIDNITVPLGTAFYFAFLSAGPANGMLIIGFSLTAAVGYLAWRHRSVTTEGALAGVGLGSAIFVTFGIGGLAVLFAFFVSSTILGRIKKERRKQLALSSIVAKGDRRDSVQVLANCGVGLVSSMLYAVTSWPVFFLTFGVSFAAATADTWAGEIGVLNRSGPVSIVGFRRLEAGMSGGVSLLGFVSSFMGALFIAAIMAAQNWNTGLGFSARGIEFQGLNVVGGFLQGSTFLVLCLIVAGGFLGSVFDSLLGATLQAQYRCAVTGRTTERPESQGVRNLLIRGLSWMTNDMVNFLGILFASLISGTVYLLLSI